MIGHVHPVGAPVLALILLVIELQQGFQERILAVVELDLARLIVLLVHPRDLLGVAGMLIERRALDNEALPGRCRLAAILVPEPCVIVPGDFLAHQILVGEFGANEGTGLVLGRYAFHPLQGRQVKPLIVRIQDLGVREKGRSLDIPRLVEHRDALVPDAPLRHFERAEPQFADTALSFGVAQDHRHHDIAVSPAEIPTVGLLGNRTPLLLGRFRVGRLQHRADGQHRQGENTVQFSHFLTPQLGQGEPVRHPDLCAGRRATAAWPATGGSR